ncbi:hypothetical protein Pst134EA_013395 [Puccinia striiformis f. sp. tritici]|uniref:T-cell immunomodulatory protein TIP C2 domain-containing protein n=1 Tax=Puccinia striiformis f. sp. tritici PST-78 TaxID=1165861 RepID=A0A0L0VHV4_9BASI|nr:hypothetical protein Pst134EA_013395 [Puccinia striiformis f. sp. tritici]KAH9465512.1 hypothetical protein Pst134EA_013395 [Puccinia striiformis f. sp. tritici]KNE98872.1 hypothetical protein PSTG_07893 [Puccinia striiformis f. sp. tritici PST-78]
MRTRLSRIVLLLISPGWNQMAMGRQEKKFKAEGLFDLGDLGINSVPADGGSGSNTIIAIGDSNADQFRDIFTLSSDQRSVNLHLWNHQLYQFVSVSENPVIPQTVGGFVITNIVVTDINYDGRLDILVMGNTDPSDRDQATLKMEVWYGINGTSFASGIPIPSSLSSHPLVFDSQGMMTMDLLGLPSSLPSVFKVWKNLASSSTSNSSTPFVIIDPPFNTPINCKLPNPHSSAFIDLDGDCLADIFLTCEDEAGMGEQSYQIWINNKNEGFSLSRTGILPRGTKGITFADMDRDGTIDMVLSVCPTPNNCSINVAYNQQFPLCSGSSQSKSSVQCRDPQNLCTADPDFRFSFDSSQSGFTTLNIDHLFPSYKLVTELTKQDFQGPSPVTIQTGDYNLDGYPDLLVIVEPIDGKSSKEGTQGTPYLLESYLCTKINEEKGCTKEAIENHRRSFKKLSIGDHSLNSIHDAKSAFFMDINEDGSLDIVVQRSPQSPIYDHNPAARSISIFKNNFFNDAFFLKAIMLNGACSSRCQAQDGHPEYRPYGVNYAGASYKFIIQDTFGERRATAVGQVPFNMYASPTSPYSFFGLGRTNNYVENMFVGSTRHQTLHYINIEGLLPNSQLVVIPFQNPGSNWPGTWKKELYLHPADWIPYVSLSLAVATLILAIIVVVLHLNQKREDERERRRKAHTINFDAL